jgi:hypothetical protein
LCQAFLRGSRICSVLVNRSLFNQVQTDSNSYLQHFSSFLLYNPSAFHNVKFLQNQFLKMTTFQATEEERVHLRRVSADFPPTPPESDLSDTEKTTSKTESTQFPLPPPSHPPTEINPLDHKTPDGWLPRDSRLIRLTGAHPFNCEAPLTDLYNEGWLTSPELFYVRNHGPVPQVNDEDIPEWEFTVEG